MNDDQILERIRLRRAARDTRIDMKTLPIPPLYGTVTLAALDQMEWSNGLGLPILLRRIFSEVGNGGFGPGAGLLGLEGGYQDPDGRTVFERYKYLLENGWRAGLLPLFDWGDGAWSAVDVMSVTGTIVTADENGFTETPFDLSSWFIAWTEGIDLHSEIYAIEDVTILNPFTRKPMLAKRRGKARGRAR